jgi:hypothetical protein
VPTIAVPHIVPVPDIPGSVQIPTLDGLRASELTDLVAEVWALR